MKQLYKTLAIAALFASSLGFYACQDDPTDDSVSENSGSNNEVDESNVSQVWLDFVAEQAGEDVTSLIPDYSYAGYQFGEQAIPTVTGTIYNVATYGAVPDDGASDRAAFEAAIAAATAAGGGIIYFPAGRYHLRDENEVNEPINISSSNIVIRGAGSGEGGTEIFMEYPNPSEDGTLYGSPYLIQFKHENWNSNITTVTADAPRGSFKVEVADVSKLSVGQWVLLELEDNSPELIAQELYPYDVESTMTQIIDDGINVVERHLITAISGNTLTLRAPITHGIESKWSWKVRTFPNYEECGVEHIAFIGNFQESFSHHLNWLHDGGYSILNMTELTNSWIQECTFTDVSVAANFVTSANVTAINCKIFGNIGHSAIKTQSTARAFFGNLDDQPSQWHSIGVSKPSIANVIWRCKTGSDSCFESHASQPRYTLFDATESGLMDGRAGGDTNALPNHMQGLTLWNFEQTNSTSTNFMFWSYTSNYWRNVMPIIVGFHSNTGSTTSFFADQVTIDESHGKQVYPESLYEAQLKLRLGTTPSWLLKLKSELYN